MTHSVKTGESTRRFRFTSPKSAVYTILGVFFSLFVYLGGYGFGHDYYAAYKRINVSSTGILDWLGWKLATLGLGDQHIGVFVVTFLLTMGTAASFLLRGSGTNIMSVAAYFFALHSWPIIMSTSNAMRQGVAMSFLYLGLYFMKSSRYILALVFFSLMTFSHKSGLIFLGMLMVLWFHRFFFHRFRFSSFFLIICSVVGSVFLALILILFVGVEEESRVIAGDIRAPAVLIMVGYLLLWIFKGDRNDPIQRFLVVCCVTIPVVLILGLNWQFERLFMIISLLLVIFYSEFTGKWRSVALLFSFFLFWSATVYMGMFNALK